MLLGGCAQLGVERQDWQVLFDGTDLSSWQGLGRTDIPKGHWVIEGETLHKVSGATLAADSTEGPEYGGDLRTLERFSDFELCFDFKLSAGANSGVKYNVSERLSAQHGHPSSAIGFEYQVLDDENHPDAKKGHNGNRTVASLYDLYPAASNKPSVTVGEWNTGCVLADGQNVSHYLNGEQVLSFEVGSPDFAEHLATSKFASIEGFAERRAGYIALQDHFDDVWYANIRIRRLTGEQL